MSSTLPLPLSSKISPPFLHKLQFLSHFTTSVSLPSGPFPKSHLCFSIPPSSNSNNSQEEAWWFREEQRWLREEQRWMREESRWNAERETLLQEINSLKLRIEELERLNSLQGASVSETVANIAKLLQVYKEGEIGKNVNRIAESGPIIVPLVVEAAKRDEEVIVKEVIKVADREENVKRRESLRKGSEGDEVRAMQKSENGAPTASITAITEVPQKVSKEGKTGDEVSQYRVFLLGENRWEEPSRLSGKSRQTAAKNDGGNTKSKCLTCRGEGRILCMECDGSGEPNIEPQFLEWVDEGTKCPYCEGLGYNTCDVCEGTKFAIA